MEINAAITTLGALSQASRLEIFRQLVRRGPQGYTPGELASKLELPAPTLSFHLKALEQAGLVVVQPEGRTRHYRANLVHIDALMQFLTDNCCSLADPGCATGCETVVAAPQVGRRRA